MKHSILSVMAFAVIVFTACNNTSKGTYAIDGKVTNLKLEGRTVYFRMPLQEPRAMTV